MGRKIISENCVLVKNKQTKICFDKPLFVGNNFVNRVRKSEKYKNVEKPKISRYLVLRSANSRLRQGIFVQFPLSSSSFFGRQERVFITRFIQVCEKTHDVVWNAGTKRRRFYLRFPSPFQRYGFDFRPGDRFASGPARRSLFFQVDARNRRRIGYGQRFLRSRRGRSDVSHERRPVVWETCQVTFRANFASGKS